MDGNEWKNLNSQELDAYERRVALVETLLDDNIDEAERQEVRRAYRYTHSVSERTIRNYIRRYRMHGRHGLLFYRHTKSASVRIHDEALRTKILELIEERPRRTVPQLRRLLTFDEEFAPRVELVSDRTIYRFLYEQGLTQKARMSKRIHGDRTAFRRFEADCSLQLVQGDARDGIWLPAQPGDKKTRKTYLFAWVDDYSRRILHAQYFWDEKLPRMEATFKTMVLRWGIPEKLYLDNGSVYIAKQFARILADLDIKKIHHGPYQAWAKGKVESVMKTLKQEFQAEAQQAGFVTLEELNTALWAWIDVEYNRRSHSTTGEPPEQRFVNGLPAGHRRIEDLQWFENLFLQQDTRKVTKYGDIKLEGNLYKTSARHGTVVEVRYNPFDLKKVWRFEKGAAVETLGVKKLIHDQAKTIAEENPDAPQKTSRDSARYFEKLRESQAALTSGQQKVSFSKLKGQEAAK
ncbi:MAG: DDE-type integrase/transposase/recombinase [Spirochaeta sp.]